jgi:hypothetical protein
MNAFGIVACAIGMAWLSFLLATGLLLLWSEPVVGLATISISSFGLAVFYKALR